MAFDPVLARLFRSRSAYSKEVDHRHAVINKLLAVHKVRKHVTQTSSVPIATNTMSFPFKKLPLELQEEIMQYTVVLPKGRIIHIKRKHSDFSVFGFKNTRLNAEGHPSKDIKAVAKTGALLSPFLHVCHDTRTWAMKYYSLSLHFGRNLQNGPILFNPQTDWLYFPTSIDLMAFFNRKSLNEHKETLYLMEDSEKTLQKIIISTDCLRSPTLPMITRFRNLDVIKLINIYCSADDRLKRHSEKLMVKNWHTNAKKGGWEVKIPKLDTSPSFAPGSARPIRDLVG